MTSTISAVRTTGIYCRAGCVAKPLERNVTDYPSPVSAEAAGYRACLKCRPDREAPWLPPESVPEPLRRAVTLISEGVLDTGSEDDLAAMVGFSTRHLRRLFLEHIGATPAFVARSGRAHFARSLLDDTTLSVTEIAFAAGFTSVRQMNRVMKEVFRFTPSELRNKRGRKQIDAVDGGLTLELRLPEPANAFEIIEFLAPRCTPGVEAVNGTTYARTLELCGHPGAIEIAAVSDAELCVTAHLPTYGGLIDVVSRVRRMFGADADYSTAVDALRNEPLIAPMVSDSPGRRTPGSWSAFEAAVRIVVGQQVTVVGASTLTGRVAASAGRYVGGLDRLGLDRLFPTAEELVEADLTGLGLTDRRISTLNGLAQAVLDDRLDLMGSADDVRSELLELPGVGAWTAELIAMRVSRDPDAFPASDLGVRKGASALAGTELLSAREVEQMAERWRPHRALAATHLWKAA